MIALKSSTKRLVAVALPDLRDWFLKNVAQYPLLFVFASAPMSKRCEAAGEHVATRSNVRKRIGTLAARPRALTKVANQTLNRRGCTRGGEFDAALSAGLFA